MIASFRSRLRGSSYWRDIIWQASGDSLAQAIGVLGMPVLTRLYSPHDFALQNLFLQVVGLATVIMTWRYEYFIQLPREDVDSRYLLHLVLWLGFITCVIVTPITWVFKVAIANGLGDKTLAPWLVFAPVTALLICYGIAFQHKVQRQKNYRRSGLSELVGKSSYIACGMFGSWFWAGSAGLIAAPAASAIGKIVSLSNINKHRKSSSERFIEVNNKNVHRFSLSGMRRLSRTYAHLSGSLVFSHVMLTCTGAIPSVFIAHTYGTEVLGQFSLVVSTIYLPSGLIGSAIGQVYYQRAAERWANGENFADLWRSTAKRLILIGLPIYTTVMIISPWIYPLIFGHAWTNTGHYATIIAVSAFLSFITSPLGRACLVVNAWWYLPIWHSARTVSTGLVAWLAWVNDWSFEVFLVMLVVQMSTLYLIDYWAEWRFSLCSHAGDI